jgi:four helix bundle protein
MPHENLLAYQVALELLREVREMGIADQKLRDQIFRASRSSCLNIAEAVGRLGNSDKKRVFAIARGECCEAAAAIDIARALEDCDPGRATRARDAAGRLYGLLTGLLRRYESETSLSKTSRLGDSGTPNENPNEHEHGVEHPNEHGE